MQSKRAIYGYTVAQAYYAGKSFFYNRLSILTGLAIIMLVFDPLIVKVNFISRQYGNHGGFAPQARCALHSGATMDFSLVKIAPSGAASANAFDDVILPLSYALPRLGYSVEVRVNSFNAHCVNILFGLNQLPSLDMTKLPAGSVIFNLEQLSSPDCKWLTEGYREKLSSFTVWDYSERNVLHLRNALGIANAAHVPLGYTPEMTRLDGSYAQNVDVLFYGALNARRLKMLESIQNTGLNVLFGGNAFGTERDYLIARSRLVLNIHFYSPGILEIPRLGYLWANGKCVISERGPQTEVAVDLDDACAYCEYDGILETAQKYVRDKNLREAQAEAGFRAFSARRQEDSLAAVLGKKSYHGGFAPTPFHLHAGSGEDFRGGCLNIDVNPQMNPDIVLDLSRPLSPACEYQTTRFGKIRLMPGSFARITAFDLLQYVADPVCTMKNFLDLLKLDGILELRVPYDLSAESRQDPRQRHAFNETSWAGYCGQAWSLGWTYTRFSLQALTYTLSEYGSRLKMQGCSEEELPRHPRAITSMQVQLQKRKITKEELEQFALKTRNFYKNAVGNWSV